MRILSRVLPLAVLSLLMCGTAACWGTAPPAPPPQTLPSPQTIADELLAADRAAADAASQAGTDVPAALSAMFAPGVVMRAPGGTLAEGIDQVTTALAALPDHEGQVTWTPVRAGISGDGLHGFTFGYMTTTRPDDSIARAKYLSYWIKIGDAWKVVAYRRVPSPEGPADTTLLPALLPEAIVPATTSLPAVLALQEELANAEQAFSDEAQRTGLGAAFAAYGTDESMNVSGPAGSGFIMGARAISETVAQGEPATGSSVRWSSERTLVASSGDLGVSIGYIHVNVPDGQPERPPIPFFTVWRRANPSAPWRYVAE